MLFHHKPIRAALTMALLLVIPPSLGVAAESLRINPQKTRIGFEVDAFGWPTTKGAFRDFQGNIRVDFAEPARSAVSFVVQADSLDAGSTAVTSFIKGATMLNTAAFPEMRFRSRSVEKLSESAVRVTGPLTFMGQTRPVSFQVDVDQRQSVRKQLRFTAQGTIKRSEFGFISGQPLIADDVRIIVTTEAGVE